MNDGAALTQEMADAIKYATIIVSTLPILCLYPFLQQYFTKGVMVGSVKG
jgi:putative aldouronate transport system permease protein